MALHIVIIIILILLSAFFSAAETAFTSLSFVQIRTLEGENRRVSRLSPPSLKPPTSFDDNLNWQQRRQYYSLSPHHNPRPLTRES